MAGMYIVYQQFPSHGATSEARGGQATNNVAVTALWEEPNEWRAVEREGHQSSPGAGDGKRVQQRQHFSGVVVVDLDTGRVRHGIVADHLAVATKDDLPGTRLAAVE